MEFHSQTSPRNPGEKKAPETTALQLQGFAYDPAAIPVFTEKDILIPWWPKLPKFQLQKVVIWKMI